MSSPIETMQKLLEGLYEEVEENESKVRKEGMVSSDFCDKCDMKRWDYVPLTSQQQITVDKLAEWARNYQIESISRDEEYIS